jgi:2-desacetyl-2-hydroxyethyl bacteriochlorophyllide A dehydrogenase
MRAAAVYGPDDIRVESMPEPEIGDYDALVRIVACGVCTGTDLHILQGRFPRLPAYPLVLGHESIGRVVEVGPKVRHFRVGDLVLRPVAPRPGERLGGYGSAFGGFAEYGVVADARAITEDTPRTETPELPAFAIAQQVVPPDFDPIDAGMFITFKETLSWLRDLGPVVGRSVVVLGTGPVGLSFVRVAKFFGADPVIAVGRRDERLELARQLGADAGVNTARQDLAAGVRAATDGRGTDYVIEAVGSSELLAESVRALANGGQIGIYGVAPESKPLPTAGAAPNWQIRSISPSESTVHDLALDLVRLGFVDIRAFVTHVLPLSDIGEAFRLIAGKYGLKPTITIE